MDINPEIRERILNGVVSPHGRNLSSIGACGFVLVCQWEISGGLDRDVSLPAVQTWGLRAKCNTFLQRDMLAFSVENGSLQKRSFAQATDRLSLSR
jgi:hypothetical protein